MVGTHTRARAHEFACSFYGWVCVCVCRCVCTGCECAQARRAFHPSYVCVLCVCACLCVVCDNDYMMSGCFCARNQSASSSTDFTPARARAIRAGLCVAEVGLRLLI